MSSTLMQQTMVKLDKVLSERTTHSQTRRSVHTVEITLKKDYLVRDTSFWRPWLRLWRHKHDLTKICAVETLMNDDLVRDTSLWRLWLILWKHMHDLTGLHRRNSDERLPCEGHLSLMTITTVVEATCMTCSPKFAQREPWWKMTFWGTPLSEHS